jgi:biotin carboxyl carrier protein
MSTVAVVTSEHADEDWVFRALDGALVVVDSAPLADVIVVSADCLDMIIDHLPASAGIVVIGDPMHRPARAVHVITRTWPDDQLRILLQAVATGRPRPVPALPPPSNPAEARDATRALAAGRKLAAATDLAACESTTVEILVELIEVDRAYCLYYDHAEGGIWSEAKLNSQAGDDRRAQAGLAGFAAITGVVASTPSAGADPRFVGEIDDPHGDATDRLIAQPIFGTDGDVHAVLVCARRGRRAPFGPGEQKLLARFALLVTPVLDQLLIQHHAQAILDDESGGDGLFRREAMDAQAMPRWGDVVRVSPGWLSFAYWLLVLLLIGSGVFVAVGTVNTYSTGTAIIRSNSLRAISSRTAGNVTSVEVILGDRVEDGAVIARLDDTDERAAVARLEREYETQLRNHMLDPSDTVADSALRTVRNQLDTARTALNERVIRADVAGVVGDVRVRAGQPVKPGDMAASIVDSSKGLVMIALMPGADRPQLAPGMEIRLELAGYRYAYQTIVIDSVSSEVFAPNEARRVLGEVAESVQIAGPVAIVHGKMPSSEFTVDGRRYPYHHGMLGGAEVRVRSEPILFAIIPGMRRFGE